MFHSVVTLNKKVLCELNIKNLILAVSATIFGLVGLIISLIFQLSGSSLIFLIVVFSLLIVLGLTFLIFLLANLQKADKAAVTIEATLEEEQIKIISLKPNQVQEEQEIPYENNYYYRETKNYLFISLANGEVLPLKKSTELVKFLNSKNIYKR